MMLWRDILSFLKHKMTTKRRNRAGQIETDWWLKSQLENGVLPKISKYRFPFHPIVEQPLKNILDDEVSIENCQKWFPLIKLHASLQENTSMSDIIRLQDYFCMSAVKNSISEYKIVTECTDAEVWHLKPINNAFLQSIIQLIKFMNDPSKVIFLLYFVTNNAPDGADQIEVAYECYKFSIANEEVLKDIPKACDTMIKIKRKYPILKTQHLLHLYGLTEEKLFQMLESPNELITALYHHDCILRPNKPDINKVSAEIAKLHGLDMDMIQFILLQKWLSLSNDSFDGDLEETYYEDFNVDPNTSQSEALSDENVIRAHYILSSWNAEKAVEFIISHIFNINKLTNTGRQLQVFECFTKLINENNSTYADVVNQDDYIVLKCIHHLKELGYNFTVEKFKDYDKLAFLKRIWKSKANDPKALEVISYICLGFDIFIPQIWNGVLKQMVSLDMVGQLSSLVVILSMKSSLLHISGLVAAWECVIKSVFKYANRTRSYEQETVLCKALVLLQTCPVASKLNLFELAERCIQLDRPHMAAILISFSKVDQMEKIIELVTQHKRDSLKSDIEELEQHGVISTVTKFVNNQLKL